MGYHRLPPWDDTGDTNDPDTPPLPPREREPGGAAALRVIGEGIAFGATAAVAWVLLASVGVVALGMRDDLAGPVTVWLLAAGVWVACRAGGQ